MANHGVRKHFKTFFQITANMIRTAVLLAFVTLGGVRGFCLQQPVSGNAVRRQPLDATRSTDLQSAFCDDDSSFPENRGASSRRELLHGLTGGALAALVGTVSPPDASAIDLPMPGMPAVGNGSNKKLIGGLASKIRNSCRIMDELQRDLMQENWDLVEAYPAQLRSYVPVFTAYTDSAFPSEAPTDKGLRVALRYEVGRFFASVERFKQAVSRKALDEAYVAYSDMSLHLDRYLRVGGLYTYYDDTITLEAYYKGISESSLVYADPKKDPPEVRDLIIMAKGPDKGKTGIVIGIYRDGSDNVAVKLDRYKGMREIRLVPKLWVAKRLGEQDPDDVFLM